MAIDYRKGEWLNEPDDGSVTFDDDPYGMLFFGKICWNCSAFRGWERFAPVCDAFPLGIPPEIWRGEFDHHNPYPEDNGIQYQKK